MSQKLSLYNLGPSPNNIKVRLALGFKNLDYETIEINPEDRKEIVKVSRQPLTPVLKHGEAVVYDSGAILRYLDANFPDTPSIFAEDADTMQKIEDWERFGKTDLPAPTAMIFHDYFGEKDPEAGPKASTLLNQMTQGIEEGLEKNEFLCGGRITAADITCAPWVLYGMQDEEVASKLDITMHFYETLKLGEGREKTRAWVKKLMAFDK